MSVDKIKMGPARFNQVLNGFKFYIDTQESSEKADDANSSYLSRIKRMYESLQKYSYIYTLDYDAESKTTDTITVTVTTEELVAIGDMADWIECAEVFGYDADYVAPLVDKVESYIASKRSSKTEDVDDAANAAATAAASADGPHYASVFYRPPMTQIGFSLPADEKARLVRKAQDEGVSLSELLRSIVADYLSE